ncbi:hypothetical protein MESS4_510223 [Mesorhizobium sp. STM 4661]|nr:hypothetical protein MESS4_510223 [Mesorhizobium sp. STM 4661]
MCALLALYRRCRQRRGIPRCFGTGCRCAARVEGAWPYLMHVAQKLAHGLDPRVSAGLTRGCQWFWDNDMHGHHIGAQMPRRAADRPPRVALNGWLR